MDKQKTGNNYSAILIVFLLGLSAFSVYKYVYSIKERYALLDTLSKEKSKLTALESAKADLTAQLSQESSLVSSLKENNLRYKDDLRAGKRKVFRLAQAYQEVDHLGHALDSQIVSLREENLGLKASNKELDLQLAAALKENQSFKTRLGSVKEIRKEIRQVRSKEKEHSFVNPPAKNLEVAGEKVIGLPFQPVSLLQESAEAAPADKPVEVAQAVEETKIDNSPKGNGGFLLRDGKPVI